MSPAERALREAMDEDPTFTSGTGEGLTQPKAIANWKQFLQRDDLTDTHRVFAWWRLGSLYAYNFDPGRGESADWQRAESAMLNARRVVPGLVSRETLNGATVFGGLAGKPIERAHRLAEAYNWLAERSEDDIEKSAPLVNPVGYVIDKRLLPHAAHRASTLQERKRLLREQLADYRSKISKRITEEIQYSHDREAIAELLKLIEPAAFPQQMKQWRTMLEDVPSRVSRYGRSAHDKKTVAWDRSQIVFLALNGLVLAAFVIILIRKKRPR